jgi:hypothetical protein
MVLQSRQELKVRFVAKLGVMSEDKFHVMIPKQFNDQVRNLKGKQVKVTIEDEF